MKTLDISIIVGSLRRDSINRQLAHAIMQIGFPHLSLRIVPLDDLPLYNQDDDDQPAVSVQRFKAEIAASHGLIFITPEYNRSYPGVLKNAIDHASRPYGKSVWGGKPAGVLGASIGTTGTALAQQHLRNVLAYLDVPVLGQPEMFLKLSDGNFDANGNVDAQTGERLGQWMNRFGEWVNRLHP